MNHTRNKKKKTVKPLFGVAVGFSMDVACYFIDQSFSYILKKGINEVGIFRICGSQLDIQELKEKISQEPLSYIFERENVHTVTGLLKQYFREMPDPLMKGELYEMWLAAAALPSPLEQLLIINNVLKNLNADNKYILGKLCYFLSQIQEKKKVNQMDAKNLALCVGPNLLRPIQNDLSLIVQDSGMVANLVKILIEHVESFWEDIESLNPFPKVFIFKDDYGQKKVPLRSVKTLRGLVEKLTLTHRIPLEGYNFVDVQGNIVDIDTDIDKIKDYTIEMVKKVSVNDILETNSSPPARIKHLTQSKSQKDVREVRSVKGKKEAVQWMENVPSSNNDSPSSHLKQQHSIGNKSPRSSFRKALILDKKTLPRSDSDLSEKNSPSLEPPEPTRTPKSTFIPKLRKEESERPMNRGWTEFHQRKPNDSTLSIGHKNISHSSDQLEYDFDTSVLDQLVNSLDQYDQMYRTTKQQKMTLLESSEELESNEGEVEVKKKQLPPPFSSKFFTLHVPYDDVLDPSLMLQKIVDSICNSQGVNSKYFRALDRYGNLIDFETPLENVVGSEVILTKL